MRSAIRLLILAAACVLAVPSPAEAQIVYRTHFPQAPAYRGVYAFPQVNTSPYHWGNMYYPTYYPSFYSPSWFGAYSYNPGYYQYWATPWGSSYYYTNPSFYYWYGFR